MKRNIFRVYLISLVSLGLLTMSANDDIIEGEWDDDWGGNPGNVEVKLQVTPKAEFKDCKLHLNTPDQNAKIYWTTETGVTADESGVWTLYTAPLTLDKDCVVSFYGMTAKGTRSDVKTYSFIYTEHQTATPVITVNDDSSRIMITCSTPDARIYYTSDGSEPNENSELYSAPLVITSYVYRARAYADGKFESEVCDYNMGDITLSVALPSAEFENRKLVLSCPDKMATIFYTTDPDMAASQTEGWLKYDSPFPLNEDCIVRFFGRRDGFSDSDVQSFTFVYSNYCAAEPTIERNEAGTHIVMGTSTEGGIIRYTTDGTEPDGNSTLYTEPVLIECNGTITAKTFADGLFDSKPNRYVISNMAVPNPTIMFSKKRFHINCLDPKAQLWYTLDADAPIDDSAAWTLYESPLSLAGNCMVRFFGRRDNFNDSDIEQLAVVIADYQLVAPSISRNQQGTHVVMTYTQQGPNLGSIQGDGDPTLFVPQIHFTSDGSEPTLESPVYESPVRIQEGAVYRAKVFDDNWLDSEISEYVIGSDKVIAPEGRFENFALVLSTVDIAAQIWYTTNPDLSVDNIDEWTLYENPIPLKDDCTYRFFAGDDDANASDVQTFVFQRADYQVMAPTIERDGEGTYIVMETTTAGADIRYTVDGSEPTIESHLYVDPVLIQCNAIYRAKAFAEGMYDSDITEFVVSNMAVPVAYASFGNRVLTLSCPDSEASIWYTTDDDAIPENISDWKLYTEPIALTEDCYIHFFARRDNFNDSDIETFVFMRANYTVATPTIERSDDGNSVIMNCATEGAVVRFTLDGTEPTAESEVYTGPVSVTYGMIVRAKGYADNMFDSELAVYEVADPTGVDEVACSSVRICNESGDLVVYSDFELTLPIYSVNGLLLRTVAVKEGRNVIPDLPRGIYIIGKTKIRY